MQNAALHFPVQWARGHGAALTGIVDNGTNVAVHLAPPSLLLRLLLGLICSCLMLVLVLLPCAGSGGGLCCR